MTSEDQLMPCPLCGRQPTQTEAGPPDFWLVVKRTLYCNNGHAHIQVSSKLSLYVLRQYWNESCESRWFDDEHGKEIQV